MLSLCFSVLVMSAPRNSDAGDKKGDGKKTMKSPPAVLAFPAPVKKPAPETKKAAAPAIDKLDVNGLLQMALSLNLNLEGVQVQAAALRKLLSDSLHPAREMVRH